jgi:hypothetical protein
LKVDFHCHSTASDGTCAPSEIADMASRGGYAAIALTDHDNCDGITEFLGADAPLARRVAGVELSIEPGEGFDKFHLLALGVDPSSPELKAFLKRVLDGRNERNAQIFANFRRLGIDIRPEPHGEVLARPHFARWLVDNGYASDIPDAFAKYLLPDSPPATRCYEERFHPGQEEAFRMVHAAGGVAVMAHPRFWRREWRSAGCDYAAAERELARLKEAGLDGLEAHYQANTPEENVEFTRIASRLGLLKSAGSDFHGANKKSISLGMEVEESFIAPLLEALSL